MQIQFFNNDLKKRSHYKTIHFAKSNYTNNFIKKKNSEVHIFRYKTLYNIYNQIYLYTYKKPLSNLNYFIEDDGFFIAEIKGSDRKFLTERLKLHIDLLRKIKNNPQGLDYSNKSVEIISFAQGQLSLFN